ncbi:MAG: hypothetical protein K6F78_03575 [Bacteroidaceae bacterium]|nr:hypothetical protein [Bacteroidaceae bacterium]
MKYDKNKSPRTIRGTATIHEDDRIEFKPYAEGEPTQLNVRSIKGGKLYTTTSEKEPKQVAHLSIDANAADPYSEYVAQLQKLGIKPQQEQPMLQKQRLMAEGGIEVYLDAKESKLTYQGQIDLSQSKNWQSELMRQLQLVVRTLPGNETFNKVINKIKKGGFKA